MAAFTHCSSPLLLPSVRYRRSYDSEFSALLVMYHVWPALVEGDSVIVKGEAVTRRGAVVRRHTMILPIPVLYITCLMTLLQWTRSRNRSRSASPARSRSLSPSRSLVSFRTVWISHKTQTYPPSCSMWQLKFRCIALFINNMHI